MVAPTLHLDSVAPDDLLDALLNPRHLGKLLEVDEELREVFYALYELCVSFAEEVRMTDNQSYLHFKRFDGWSQLFAKVKIRPRCGKINVSIWSGAPIPLAYARDVRLLDTPNEDCELEITTAYQVHEVKPHIMESFRIASMPYPGRA